MDSSWQKGYSLSSLKSIAEVFKTDGKPYAMGPFGLPNEAAVATALSAGSCIGGRIGKLKWAAILNTSKRAVSRTDFAKRTITFPPGTPILQHFAAGGAYDEAVHACLQRIGGRAIFEIFEEHKAMRAALLDAGAEYLLTRVAASSELRSFYSVGVPMKTAPLPVEETWALCQVRDDFISKAKRDKVLAEVDAYDIQWAQHYSSYNKRQSWTAFSLRGYQPGDPNFIIKPSEMSKKWKAENPNLLDRRPDDTVAAKHFPTAMAIATSLPGPKDRIRLMKLAPGGELTRHADITDEQAGIADGFVSRMHIPLVTSEQVSFNAIDHRGNPVGLNLKERGLYYLDQRKPHFVRNGDPSHERIHLVIDVFSNPKLRGMFDA